MATSRYQGHCRTSALEDDDHDDAVIMPKTASVMPLAGNIPSTPPRNKQILGLVTPPDSRSRPNSDFRSTSPPRTPVRRSDAPKDTEPLTVLENLSEWSSDQSTTIPFLPLTGLLTPDNTPPRLSKPRSRPISHKKETTDKSESSLSLEIISTVVKISEISEHNAEHILYTEKSEHVETQRKSIAEKTKSQSLKSAKAPNRLYVDQDTGISEQAKTQCNGLLKTENRRCHNLVKAPNSFCHHHDKQDTGPPPSIPSANGKGPQSRQSRDTTAKPTTSVNSKPPVQHNHEHPSQCNITPTTVRRTPQCSAIAKSTGRQCEHGTLTAPGQLTKDSSQPVFCRVHTRGNVKHVDVELTKVQKELSARLSEFIPEYLQLDTQQKLRNAIKKGLSSRHKEPGYVYALDVSDPDYEGKLVLKIGFSENVKKRHKQWQTKHPLSIKDVRGWWPKTIIEAKDDDKTLIQSLIDSNDQGAFGLMAAKLEQLVHIELWDLVTHVAYLHPDFPKVLYSDLKYQDKAVPKPCGELCSGYPKTHKEIFAFTRVEKGGKFFKREWEDIVKPVIRKWGLFLMEYYAEGDDAMSFDYWALSFDSWALFITIGEVHLWTLLILSRVFTGLTWDVVH